MKNLIRNLHHTINDTENNPTIEDIVRLAADLSKPAILLEIEDNTKAYGELRDGLKEMEDMVRKMRRKLRYEVLIDINEAKKKRVPNPRGNAESLPTVKNK